MKLFERVILRLSLLLCPTSAVAEVCDKVSPDWKLASGPVGHLELLFNATVSPLGILLLALIVFGAIFRKTWTSLLGSVISALYAYVIWLEWTEPGGVYSLSISEGCRASPEALLSILCLVAIGLLGVAAKRYLNR